VLLGGFNHVAVLTRDTERLQRFYEEVFDAEIRPGRRQPATPDHNRSVATGRTYDAATARAGLVNG